MPPTSQEPARTSDVRMNRRALPGGPWSRCRLVAAALCNVLAAALVAAGCSGAGQPAAGAASGAARPAWLCQPGQHDDPCVSSLAVSAVSADGTVSPTTWPSSATASKFDCFYLYPTASLSKAPNAPLAATALERYIAKEQTAPFSNVCTVWAPLYREQTLPSVLLGLGGNEALMRSTAAVAYDSLLPTWRWFLAHSGNKPIILIGDSQGSTVLIHLISAEIDHEPAVLRRLVVAILVGGNLQVPAGKLAGSTFTRVPLCTAATETGCAIAFSSYPSEPPAYSVFGRPGRGTSLQAWETGKAGQQVACVNPAALSGGTAELDPYLLTASQLGLKERVTSPWVTYPGLYSAACKQGGGATWLQITSLAGTSHTRPLVQENTAATSRLVDTGPAWGYHDYEYWLTLGNLLRDVGAEEAAWQSKH
jgi:hypothetical protein